MVLLTSSKKVRSNSIKRLAKEWGNVNNLSALVKLVREEEATLKLLGGFPRYHVFKMPKKNGKFRLIEDPEPKLKKVLKLLNTYWQALYHEVRPSAVYGFCISVGDEEERNIVNNAKRHIGKQYMVNIDLKDFFHTVSYEKVQFIVEHYFKIDDKELLNTLCNLITYKDRLPMGAPTSPIVSNFACMHLDEALIRFCEVAKINYTRFADDMTFSANHSILLRDIEIIKGIVQEQVFVINAEKFKIYRRDEQKMVTGIVVTIDSITLPTGYLEQLRIEIERYRQLMIAEQRYQTGMSFKKLKLFKQELHGKLNFAKMVEPDSEEVLAIEELLHEVLETTYDFESIEWLDLPYM